MWLWPRVRLSISRSMLHKSASRGLIPKELHPKYVDAQLSEVLAHTRQNKSRPFLDGLIKLLILYYAIGGPVAAAKSCRCCHRRDGIRFTHRSTRNCLTSEPTKIISTGSPRMLTVETLRTGTRIKSIFPPLNDPAYRQQCCNSVKRWAQLAEWVVF